MSSKLHTSPTATPMAPNFWTNKIQNCLHVLQRNHRCRSLLSFWAATPLQSFPLSPLFVRHTQAQNPTLQLQNPWLLHFLTIWPPHLEQSPPRHQALCYSLFLQKPTQGISLLRIFQLSHIVLHSYQSVQCVRACVNISSIAFKNPCRHLFFLITFSISMYIMCVCLFSALCRRVGTLQISIIIKS